jgi:hypothetical protein
MSKLKNYFENQEKNRKMNQELRRHKPCPECGSMTYIKITHTPNGGIAKITRQCDSFDCVWSHVTERE